VRARRRHGVVAAAAGLLLPLLLLPGAARAQTFATLGGDGGEPRHYHSPQHFAFQLSFGPYTPDIDSEFTTGRHPYQDYYGSGGHLMSQGEFEYLPFRKMGSLGVGLGVGFFQVSGTAPQANTTATPSGDKSTLTVVPVSLSLVYRFDYFLETRNFPIYPYAKLGFDWAYWQVTDGNGEIATDGRGGSGRGGTFGWHAVIGVALILDMLDPEAARSFDSEMGVNHTGIMFEYGHYDISGLGASDRLHVGDNAWTVGLLLEF
jgi:hypothetical protein